VRDQVGNRLAFQFADQGEQQLKNIEKPVRDVRCFVGGAGAHCNAVAKKEKPSIAVLHSPT